MGYHLDAYKDFYNKELSIKLRYCQPLHAASVQVSTPMSGYFLAGTVERGRIVVTTVERGRIVVTTVERGRIVVTTVERNYFAI